MLQLSLYETFDLLRKRQGMTLVELAAKSGICRNILGKWSKDIRGAKLSSLIAVANALEYDIHFDIVAREQEADHASDPNLS